MPERDLTPYVIPQLAKPDDGPHPRYDFARIFGNDHPVELEIGIGKGRFIINQAMTRPDTNFIGIEWANRYYLLAARRAAGRSLHNLRLLRDDAAHTVRESLPDRCLNALHIYFPDPWPKTKHHKRRLVQPWFAREASRVLKPGARVFLATDHEDYAQQMEQVFKDDPDFALISRMIGEDAPEGITNWEVKFRAEGRTMFKFEFARK
ncbi:MAG: tRNA (guanosine(46)-N7)-methyltransferase TrmB [Planctomycetes bacterium]|nr:tRNA (guanosine(46)-N7)-methyltransferase TrmB [Planctomycetota bacterium]